MADPALVTVLLFGGLFVLLALGTPIAFALGGFGALLIAVLWSPGALNMVPMRAFEATSSFQFLAIPLFIFMASTLQRSGIAQALYDTMQTWVGTLRGGLAVGTILICTLFAAMAGISGAATIAMGMLAVPAMMERGYAKRIALGSVAAGGSLGILIPPSVTMIVYGLVSGTSIGRLYAGGILPGLLIAGFFIVYLLLRGYLQPALAGGQSLQRYALRTKLISLKGLVVPLALVVGVLGSILGGLASVTEAATVGAAGALGATIVQGRFTLGMLREICDEVLRLSCMIFWIVIGASALSTFYTAAGATRFIEGIVLGLDVDPYLILAGILLILLALGMVLDTVGIIMITAPIVVPIVTKLGFDPVWFGILYIVMMEIGFLTPPFGYNLFYLRGVSPPSVTMGDIYRSVLPFVALMLLATAVMVAVPEIILFLPELMF